MKSGRWLDDLRAAELGVLPSARPARLVDASPPRFRGCCPRPHPGRSPLPASMNGFGALALAGRDRRHGAARGDRACPRPGWRRRCRLDANSSRCLISSQLVRLPPVAVVLHAHQHPAAVQPLALERELQLALRQRLVGRLVPFRLPIAAVPQHAPCRRHTGPWGWCLRNRRSRADGPRPRPPAACPAGSSDGPSRHRPGLEHAVELQAKIVVQPGRGVLLDDEAQTLALVGTMTGLLARRSWVKSRLA